MQSFDYIAAKSVDEVLSVIAKPDGNARILSGGTALLVQLREGRRTAGLVIDVKGIPELTEITFDPKIGLRIGAAASCHEICANPIVQERYPGLADGIHLIGGVQIRTSSALCAATGCAARDRTEGMPSG